MSSAAEVLTFVEQLCGALGTVAAHRVARLLDNVQADLQRVSSEYLTGSFADDLLWAESGLRRMTDGRVREWSSILDRLQADGVKVLFSGSSDYPDNLRLVPNRPPILFVRGSLLPADVRAIAVVGTRSPSSEGRLKAAELARRLSRSNITVVSGLAEGIDTAAHTASLDAGGRTIAVLGTGITRTFPSSNRLLAKRLCSSGACVSQWWPDQAPTKWTFPLRNIVTSGLSLGTVVVEAGETSGARLQAQDARRHGRRLFLLNHVVNSQAWARELVGQPGVHVVQHVHEIDEQIVNDLESDSFSLS